MSEEVKEEFSSVDSQLEMFKSQAVEEINEKLEEVNPRVSVSYDIKNTEE